MKITEREIKDLGLTKSKETYIEIAIKADVNDADYINSTNRIDSIKDYLKLSEIDSKINLYKGRHNWENSSDYLNDDEIDEISEYLPYLDNEEIHTIESISFRFVVDGVIYE